MFIQTETTPNPLTLKFVPGRPVLEAGVKEFRTAEDAAISPLAQSLFEIDGVARVFFGSEFLTVTRRGEGVLDWPQLKAPVLAAIMEHYTSGASMMRTGQSDGRALGSSQRGDDGHTGDVYEGEAAEIVAEIKDLLDTRVRPAVAQDGGDILFDRFELETGTVWLHMRGACSGCPSSSATLKSGVESMLRHYVPEVNRVEQAF